MDKKSLIIYTSWWQNEFNDFTPAEIGEIITALMDYVNTDAEPRADRWTDRAVKNAFLSCMRTVKADQAKYESKCKKLAENGTKGGRPSKDLNEFQKTALEKLENR